MGSAPAIVTQRWKGRNLAGAAKHQLVVRVRKGSIVRGYQSLQMLSGPADPIPLIWKGNNNTPWMGTFEPAGDWITVTEIESAKTTKAFSTNNGVGTLTVVADDIAFLNTEGTAGVYHEIQRGYYSPQRGYSVAGRSTPWPANSWENVLNGGYQIELWEGYGPDGDPSVIPLDSPISQTIEGTLVDSCSPPNPAITRTWVGLIDTCELDSHPDMITITARDFGKALTDQRMIYHNKAPECPSPVIFADRRQVLGEQDAGYDANASGYLSGWNPSGVLPSYNGDGGWVSEEREDDQDKVWLRITLPGGAYDQFFLSTPTPGMTAWVAIYAAEGSYWNDQPVSGWVDNGLGSVTYTEGDDEIDALFVAPIGTVAQGGQRYNLDGSLRAAEGTQLYVFFSDLNTDLWNPVDGTSTTTAGWVASVHRLWGYRYGTDASAPVPDATAVGATSKCQGWVLIDDVADIVRMVLMWAGFKEWSIENFGWSLAQPFTFGQDQYFMDVITSVMNQANWYFYMKSPTDHDLSIGVPAFRQQSAVTTVQPEMAFSVRDSDLLEAITATYDNSDLPYSFRVRGAIYDGGVTFGQDLSKRYEGTYFPPWSGLDYIKKSPESEITAYHLEDQRLSGINRNYVMAQGQVISLSMNSDAECLYAAILTAVQYELAANVAQFQVSGLPSNLNTKTLDGGDGQVELNGCVSVIDEGSGTNSRVWISSIESDHSMGPDGSWHMTISGALLDYEDMNFLREDWAYAVYRYSMEKGGT